jgi:hypothetical protein
MLHIYISPDTARCNVIIFFWIILKITFILPYSILVCSAYVLSVKSSVTLSIHRNCPQLNAPFSGTNTLHCFDHCLLSDVRGYVQKFPD